MAETTFTWRDDLAAEAVETWQHVAQSDELPRSVDHLTARKRGPRQGKARKSYVLLLAGVGPKRLDIVAKLVLAPAAELEALMLGDVLPAIGLFGIRHHGTAPGPPGYTWVFQDAARGAEYDSDAHKHRLAAASWLARLHERSRDFDGLDRLLPRASDVYLRHLERAEEQVRAGMANEEAAEQVVAELSQCLDVLDDLRAMWSLTESALHGSPQGLIHADLVPKNMRLDPSGTLLAFDWEMACWGPVGVDLFTTGVASSDVTLAAYSTQGTAISRRDVTLGKLLRTIAATDWITAVMRSSSPTLIKYSVRDLTAWLRDAIDTFRDSEGRAAT